MLRSAARRSGPRLCRFALSLLAAALCLTPCAASAQTESLRLPRVFSDHMVLQRERPIHVWGWGAPSETVTVGFRGQSLSTRVDDLGRWSLYLSAGAAGGPFDLFVKSSAPDESAIHLSDILVGDVWLASGQSNMEFELYKSATATADLATASLPNVRLLTVNKLASEYAQPDFAGTGWVASSPESAHNFSAVAWYFAREISAREHVPIGVIDSTWGGTVAESWTRLTALGDNAALAPIFAEYGQMTDREATAQLEDKHQERERAAARAAGKPEPQFPWHPVMNSWAPSMLWNGMIAPFTPFPIRGVLWYQGESNSALARAPHYATLFSTLIRDWRAQWDEGDFPFLFVQIANFKSTPAEDWATIRQAQLDALSLRDTGMAVTIDIGNPDGVHPTDKQTVGHRLALAARRISYGENVEDSGPIFRQATTEGSALRLWFDHAQGLHTEHGGLTSFEVAGSDGIFHPAEATIDGETILVRSSNVSAPVTARYGWANSPECHLYNAAGLPASPFTTQR